MKCYQAPWSVRVVGYFFLVVTMVILTTYFSQRWGLNTPSAVDIIKRSDDLLATRTQKMKPITYAIYPDTDDPEKLKDPTFFDSLEDVTPIGTGWLGMTPRGRKVFMTNQHVVNTTYCTNYIPGTETLVEEGLARKNGIHPTFCLITPLDGTKRVFRARVIATDHRDLAALLPDPSTDMGENTNFVLAQSSRGSQGRSVMVLGNPLGQKGVLFTGRVARSDFIATDDSGAAIPDMRYLSLEMPTRPGNSGGPLVLLGTGELVGMIVHTTQNQLSGTYFDFATAIPVEDIRAFLATLDRVIFSKKR